MCYTEHMNEHNRDDQRRLLSEAARAMAAARKVVGQIRCAMCGKAVVATTAGRFKKRYCSPACTQRAYWHRNRERLNQQQRERYQQRRAQEPTPDAPSAGRD
jgi:hypothetical protein